MQAFVSCRYAPNKQEPGDGHDREIGPWIWCFGGAEEGSGGDETREDKMEKGFHGLVDLEDAVVAPGFRR